MNLPILCLTFLQILSTLSGVMPGEYANVTAHSDKDSLYIEGIERPYYGPIHLPLLQSAVVAPAQKGQKAFVIPSGLRSVKILFDEKINGYTARFLLYPDKEDSSVGYIHAEFFSEGKRFSVKSGYDWNWWNYLRDREDASDWMGKTYICKVPHGVVQGESESMGAAPFFFKDMDFDGEMELVFSLRGYNRTYYNVYRIPADGKEEAMLMTARPYNNLVDGYGSTSTKLDYQAKTISVIENLGAAEMTSDLYRRREIVDTPDDPMVLERGEHYLITAADDYFYTIASSTSIVEDYSSYRTDRGGFLDVYYKIDPRINALKLYKVIYKEKNQRIPIYEKEHTNFYGTVPVFMFWSER